MRVRMKVHSPSLCSRIRMAVPLTSYKTDLWQAQLKRTSGQKEGGRKGGKERRKKGGEEWQRNWEFRPAKQMWCMASGRLHLNAIGFQVFFPFRWSRQVKRQHWQPGQITLFSQNGCRYGGRNNSQRKRRRKRKNNNMTTDGSHIYSLQKLRSIEIHKVTDIQLEEMNTNIFCIHAHTQA